MVRITLLGIIPECRARKNPWASLGEVEAPPFTKEKVIYILAEFNSLEFDIYKSNDCFLSTSELLDQV